MARSMSRQDEIRKLLKMSPAQMRHKAGDKLVVLRDIDALHRHFAESIAAEIKANNAKDRLTKLILPVGPAGQYPILAEIINHQRISLKQCWFFMMDEHCDDNGIALSPDHPLSFRHAFDELFASRVKRNLKIPAKQLVFPDHLNVQTLKDRISDVGGIDTTYGGIGIHGHIAYNEPERNVRESDPRVVYLNDFTRTINAIRAEIGGNLEGHPRKGVTLGMRQLLGASRIRLYCRNGISLDWANTVLRLALFGQPGDDYPVTYIRDHKDYVMVTDEDTARKPRFIV
jgi:glucosamine-6-phosphate deaminase